MKKYQLIIVALGLILLLALIILYFLTRKNQNTALFGPSPTPTLSISIFPRSLTIYPEDSLPTPAQTMPDQTIQYSDKTKQFNALMDTLPLNTPGYTLSFDYVSYKFQVLIWNDQGEAEYHKLRAEKYPLLTDDQFDIIDKRM